MIRTALNTSSLEVARARRDAMAEADELYWRSLESQSPAANDLYTAAKKRAMARGYLYIPVDDLATNAKLEEILLRLKQIDPAANDVKPQADAVLGLVNPAAPKISETLDIYCDKICISEMVGKSPAQMKSWRKVKARAVKNFISICGDLTMDEIDRTHARKFYDWWGLRIKPVIDVKPAHPNTANRDLGNLRNLYSKFWIYQGDESRDNPFRKLRFGNVVYKDVPPFESDWIKNKILRTGVFDNLNDEACNIVYAMIETGCRPSEISNLLPENIVLDHKVPHLQIRNRFDRKLKSNSAVRDIPLLGISLKAMRESPNGFPRYRDKGNTLSVTLLKAFRTNDLFPTKDHRIYSIRHSFEKRMQEADIDYGLRCTLMGHYNNRPEYGDGGSLQYRKKELQKIVVDIS